MRSIIESFVGADSRRFAVGDAAHIVAARFAGGEPDFGEFRQKCRCVFHRHEVQLDRLPRRDMYQFVAGVIFRTIGELPQLRGTQSTEHDPHSDHMHIRLALRVRAVNPAEALEKNIVNFARGVPRKLGGVRGHFLAEDGIGYFVGHEVNYKDEGAGRKANWLRDLFDE